DLVALDLHAPAPAVAELTARHVAVEPLPVQLEPGGQALDDRDEAGPVRLARGCESERHAREKASRPRAEAWESAFERALELGIPGDLDPDLPELEAVLRDRAVGMAEVEDAGIALLEREELAVPRARHAAPVAPRPDHRLVD